MYNIIYISINLQYQLHHYHGNATAFAFGGQVLTCWSPMVLQGMALWAVPAPCWRSAEWGLPLGFKGISGKKTWQEKIPFECRIFLCHGEWTQGIMMLLTKINTDNIMGYIQWSNATLIATMYNVWVCRLSIFMVYTMVLTLKITILIGKMIVNHWILWVPYSGKGATDSSITLPRCLWIVDAPFDWRMSQPKGMNHTPFTKRIASLRSMIIDWVE